MTNQEHWYRALEQGRFLLQQCRSCGQYLSAPQETCSYCDSDNLRWREASGRGVVSQARLVMALDGDMQNKGKVLIDLEEGPRISALIVDKELGEIEPGLQVLAHIGCFEGQPQVMFSSIEEDDDEW